jgi:hypothetical protein
MQIKALNSHIQDTSNATVTMNSGDHLSVGYTDPNGKFHIFDISAQHLVFLVSHRESEATMLIRPSVGVQYVEPPKKQIS